MSEKRLTFQQQFNEDFEEWAVSNVPEDARAALKTVAYHWYIQGGMRAHRLASRAVESLAAAMYRSALGDEALVITTKKSNGDSEVVQ